MVEAALRRWMRGRLAYNCCSLASSASRLAISLDSCELSKVGVSALGVTSVRVSSRLVTVFLGFGATVATAALGAASLIFRLGGGGGVTLLTMLSWNGATSVVVGIAFLSRVPLPCWFSWAIKSALAGLVLLLEVGRGVFRGLLVRLG